VTPFQRRVDHFPARARDEVVGQQLARNAEPDAQGACRRDVLSVREMSPLGTAAPVAESMSAAPSAPFEP